MSTTTPPAPAAAKKTAAKKAIAKKAPAKKTTAPAKHPAKKAAAPARPAKKTAAPAQRTAAAPATKKKAAAPAQTSAGPATTKKTPAKKKAPAKSIGAQAMRAAKFTWEHPVLALVGTTAVAGTVLYRGALRPVGRAARAVGSWAWDTGRAYVIRRRRSARPLTTGTHANCHRCKGTGTLARHDAHGRFLGSISCTG
ncbi:hypothetical protein ACFV84_35145 [Kitasatospora sp. NPDC059811]|uniref:hypothetical protein n=1 Tax=Streptomycetaceae TaxID=2062 RepID=UPI0007AF917A|nr:hypothetical protein [Streptomyces sp. MJM8645]